MKDRLLEKPKSSPCLIKNPVHKLQNIMSKVTETTQLLPETSKHLYNTTHKAAGIGLVGSIAIAINNLTGPGK